MSDFVKAGGGYLSPAKERKGDKSPHYTGSFTADEDIRKGEKVFLSGWKGEWEDTGVAKLTIKASFPQEGQRSESRRDSGRRDDRRGDSRDDRSGGGRRDDCGYDRGSTRGGDDFGGGPARQAPASGGGDFGSSRRGGDLDDPIPF